MNQRVELFRSKTQLEAYTTAEAPNSKDTKQFQVSQTKETSVGRELELSQIKKLFNANDGIIECAIIGAAGLGKSQLATEYIIRNQNEMYSEVVWLHAEQNDLTVDQMRIYLETCYKIKFDKKEENKKLVITKRFYQTLGNVDGGRSKSIKKHCIIFDSVDNMEQLVEYLPDSSSYPTLKVDILVTSRYKKWDKPVEMVIEMQAFGIEDMKNYVRKCLAGSRVKQVDDEQLSKDVLAFHELIGGLPLAFSLAMAYIQQKEIIISNFCDLFVKENNKEFISQKNTIFEDKTTEELEDHSENLNFISTVLILALVDLKRKNHNVEFVLDIIAYLSPDNISTNLVFDCWIQCQNKENISSQLSSSKKRSTLNQLLGEEWTKLLDIENAHEDKECTVLAENFEKALELLLSYSIIAVNPVQNQLIELESEFAQQVQNININVHQLTQQVIRLNHQRSGVYERNYENVFRWVFAELDYDIRDMRDVRRAGLLVPHGIYLENLQNHISDHEMAKFQEKIADQQDEVGKYSIALKYHEKALLLKEKHYGKDHPEISKAHVNLGNVWEELGGYEKQRDLFTRALEITEKHYGSSHPETGKVLSDLAGELGDYGKQKDLLT